MKIYLAKNSGFCFGVKKAVDTALSYLDQENHDPVYTYGPLIHNEEVIKKLEKGGVNVVQSIDDVKNGHLIIRSHGVGETIEKQARDKGLHLVDATCVFVKKVHRIVKDQYQSGKRVVILGNPQHPEVVGINGWCEDTAIIASDLATLKTVDLSRGNLAVVAQTTLNTERFKNMCDYITSQNPNTECFNTICSATRLRQDEARQLAKIVDFMLVVGGKNSSNTTKLYQIALGEGIDAQHIENSDEINVNFIKKYDKIGVVAGASTPDWIINEVIHKLKCEGEVVFNGKQ